MPSHKSSKNEQNDTDIENLKSQLADREKDVEVYRKELLRTNHKLEALIRNVHSQLKKAMQIQKQIVPTELPHMPGYEISSKYKGSSFAGGDYFDLFETNKAMDFGLLLSSASGYGLSSLFLSLFMKFNFDSRLKKDNPSPEKLLDLLKNEMSEEIRSGSEFSYFYGLFDRRHMSMTYINIGDNVVIHLSNKKNKMSVIKQDFTAMGAGRVIPHIQSQVIQLEAKDKLVLCSPGLFKVKSVDGEMYGLERLYSLIKTNQESEVHDLRNEIFYQVSDFAHQGEFSMDQTVIVLEAKDRVLKLA